MTITLRIDRIVLDGVPLQARDVAGLRDALQVELATLLSGAREPRRSVFRSQALGEAVTCQSRPADLARDVARSIHGALRERQRR